MKFGITQTFSCSYLPEQHEQLLVYAERDKDQATRYGQLIQAGFRRSGDQIYRPHCPSCNACQSLRIAVNQFVPSRSQTRILKRNTRLRSELVLTPKEEYYALYERYIGERHADGTMFPPSHKQYESFILCHWKRPVFIEAWKEDTLVAVAVTDDISDGCNHTAMSALYTFYAPELEKNSIGTWMILQQIAHAKQLGRQYLYLGYQIEGCNKMNYKGRFLPNERFIENKWRKIDKNLAY
ncbi:arginyltransferase [Alteromonas pelagimontana]|uniref:Aspartate/glutamate leucyltransferase n=1 Tax=Alteromonas pelagimontana TaxID=1858656 RepID=A0A6M4MH65_9ALTE|nr:arginyltransferase [Alteromonas pelagimontana]QJR82423.1 arginyltransferase [Alteromonas pelagimontana]